MGPTWLDHLIDFWVIFVADLAAAYVALTWLESRKEDRSRAVLSLNELLMLSATFLRTYQGMYDRFKNASDSNGTGFSKTANDEDKQFAGFANDALFWGFKGAEQVRSLYDGVRNLKDTLNANTVGEAKQKLLILIEQLNKLKTECEHQINPKRSWLPFK